MRLRLGADCPDALRAAAGALFDPDADWTLPREGFARLDDFLRAASASGHELRAYPDALAFVAEARDAEWRVAVLAKAYPKGDASPALGRLLNVPLYPYQAEGQLRDPGPRPGPDPGLGAGRGNRR